MRLIFILSIIGLVSLFVGCQHRQGETQELEFDVNRALDISEFWLHQGREIWERWEGFEAE